MRDVLSQNEIDSLISSLARGEIQEDKKKGEEDDYQKHDFRRPTKFSKEQLRTLQVIHKNYARIMGNFLSAYLRVAVRMKVLSVSQVTYEEFLLSLPLPTLMTVYNMAPNMGLAMLEISPSMALSLVDLIFGGEGNTVVESRELTEIELAVMREINTKFLENLGYVWKGIASLEPQIENMDTNPQFNQVISPGETVALITVSVSIGGNEGLMSLCFPYLSLEKIASNLTAQFWFDSTAQSKREQVLEMDLDLVEVDVSVVLGRAVLSLEDLLQLQVGDLITLERREKEALEILLEDQYVFKGQPGTVDNKMAVSITDWAEKEDR